MDLRANAAFLVLDAPLFGAQFLGRLGLIVGRRRRLPQVLLRGLGVLLGLCARVWVGEGGEGVEGEGVDGIEGEGVEGERVEGEGVEGRWIGWLVGWLVGGERRVSRDK